MRTFKTGDTFLHYRIGRLLGEGFHGQVHELIHPHTGDRFALKTMQLAHVGDARAARRALAEARGTYGIDHANVVRVFDLNCEEDGLVWMRTELLEGETLADLLARLGFLSPLFALSALIEAAHGLHAAHEAQIIHRDVKPANLFHVRPTRAIKVIDFSIAKFFAERFETTAGRAGMGTPAYMGPEQLEGMLPTPSFDIYALGITGWQLLAGRHPWRDVLNHSQELFHKHFTEMPASLVDIAGVPPEVDRVIQRAVAKDPRNRFHTMRDLAQALVDLRAQLERDAAAGRILLHAPPGEPPIPGDPRGRRDYTPSAPIPRGEEPTPVPSARVVVRAPLLAKTTPLGGGTVPLASEPLPRRDALTPLEAQIERGAELLPSPPAPARSPETPTAVTRSVAASGRRRVPWIAVFAVVALASGTAGGLAWWLGRAPISVAPATSPSSPSTASAPVASAPAEAPARVPSAPPTASTSSSAPRPSPPPRAPQKATPRPPAPLTPQPLAPAAPPRARGRTFDTEN